jgi:uncharacterized protein (TIGR04255 family)
MTTRHYSRSPIVEAIIDFQIKLPEGVGPSDLELCQDAAYSDKKPLNVMVDRVDFGTEGSTARASPHVGFLFTSADAKQLFQARCDGFTVHRLAPYPGWEPFREEARRVWDIYRRVAHPQRVKRIAVRYLNQFDLPLLAEITDFLRTFPEVAPDLPQALAGFGLELNIPLPDIKSTLLLRERVKPPTGPGMASVVLDIDLFRSDEIPPDEAGVWAFIETLRARKNAIFEACITNRVREAIQYWQNLFLHPRRRIASISTPILLGTGLATGFPNLQVS